MKGTNQSFPKFYLPVFPIKKKSKLRIAPAIRGGSRAAEISNMECFVIIVNGLQPLTIITRHSILDVAAALDPPLSHYVSNV